MRPEVWLTAMTIQFLRTHLNLVKLIHKDQDADKRLQLLKIGLNKKYGDLSVLNQIILYLADELQVMIGEEFFGLR